MQEFTYIQNAHPQYLESLFRDFTANPDSVEPSWRRFFEGYRYALGDGQLAAAVAGGPSAGPQAEKIHKEFKVQNLITGYRQRGHFFCRTNPVRDRRKYLPTLDLENFGLADSDLDTVFEAGAEIGLGPVKLRDIVAHLKQTYCGAIGVEFLFIRVPHIIQWLQTRMESSRNTPNYSLDDKKHILHKLNQAVLFENFLHTKYVGQKRFALTGGETLIPGLDAIVETGADMGVAECVIGMPHRGRLNVLANTLNKAYEEVFSEFEGFHSDDDVFEGDVKYHMGFSNDVITRKGHKVHLSLAPNPSHLESVNGVVLGMARAKIDKRYKGDEKKLIPILIHGDAAMAGQGIVYEVVQMAQLRGYRAGGSLHVVVNNQIGFTTNYLDGRSSTYCTDIGKVTRCPIFHVNADDVEAVTFVMQLAVEYRQTFHSDVFIDLLGYRRYGHNEADEPRFTQPKLYKIIEKHPDPRKIYADRLLAGNDIEHGLAETMEREFHEMLNYRLTRTKEERIETHISTLKHDWEGFRMPTDEDFEKTFETGVDIGKLRHLAGKIFDLPKDVRFFSKISKLYEERLKRIEDGTNLDWAICETLAYGTLLSEKTPIRISGQDCERGTFAHRHAVLKIVDENEEGSDHGAEDIYLPLNNLGDDQAKFSVYNSLLAEYGVLGFEMGYAMANPLGLVVWEAQFGDFANCAQVIIDQYLCCSQVKWKRVNGLVLYLPHGYEGAGPEHSSARIERFLNLCAANNMQVVNCSTPANLFHVLRRQMHQPFRLPLIVFTPKSLLRHKRCVSKLEDLTVGGFQPVIDDAEVNPKNVQAVMFCSGKIYYELLERREAEKRNDIAIVRLEQLYPLPKVQLQAAIDRYKSQSGKDLRFIWVQEEPENMGPWPFLRLKFTQARTWPVTRKESATIATGFHHAHDREQKDIIDRAFAKAGETIGDKYEKKFVGKE